MGFFDFLISKTARSTESSSEFETFAHQRYHARYIVNNRDLCTIEHPKFGSFRVVDLSHHGAFVESVGEVAFESASFPIKVELTVCGTSIPVEVSQVQRRRNGWGLVFRHTQEESIRNIATLIEPLRLGSTVLALESDHLRDGVFAKQRRRFKGDGNFDLVYEKNDMGEPVFVMATIRYEHGDGSVIWDRGRIITKKAAESEGARMPKTAEVDEDLLWVCAAACLGMKFPEGAICAKVFVDWLAMRSSMMPLAKSS